MGTVGQQVSVSGAIANSQNVAGSPVLYACPASSYAIVHVHYDTLGTNHYWTIGGMVISQPTGNNRSGGGTFTITTGGADIIDAPWTLYVGPGQSVQFHYVSGAVGTAYITGVQFTNGS